MRIFTSDTMKISEGTSETELATELVLMNHTLEKLNYIFNSEQYEKHMIR